MPTRTGRQDGHLTALHEGKCATPALGRSRGVPYIRKMDQLAQLYESFRRIPTYVAVAMIFVSCSSSL